jgi:hypothetical protein
VPRGAGVNVEKEIYAILYHGKADGWQSVFPSAEAHKSKMHATAHAAIEYMAEDCGVEYGEIEADGFEEFPGDPLDAMQCNCCDFATDNEEDLKEHEDTWDRVSPGEVMPAGQCPVCDGTVQASDRQIINSGNETWWAMALRARGYTVIEPKKEAGNG